MIPAGSPKDRSRITGWQQGSEAATTWLTDDQYAEVIDEALQEVMTDWKKEVKEPDGTSNSVWRDGLTMTPREKPVLTSLGKKVPAQAY